MTRFPDLASVTGTVDLVDGGVATVRWDGRVGSVCRAGGWGIWRSRNDGREF